VVLQEKHPQQQLDRCYLVSRDAFMVVAFPWRHVSVFKILVWSLSELYWECGVDLCCSLRGWGVVRLLSWVLFVTVFTRFPLINFAILFLIKE
jgi:hypothetical protein